MRPAARKRSKLALTQSERGEISRGSPVHARARHITMDLACSGFGMSLARVADGFGRDW